MKPIDFGDPKAFSSASAILAQEVGILALLLKAFLSLQNAF